jgi:hypothetical protein
MHVLVRYRDEADTEFTWSTNGYAATSARDDAAMTDSGAERAALAQMREALRELYELAKHLGIFTVNHRARVERLLAE